MNTNKINILYISHESGMNGAPRSLIGMIDSLEEYVNPLVILPCRGDLEELLVSHKIKYRVVPFKNGYGKIGEYTKQEADEVYHENLHAANIISKIAITNHIQVIHSNSSVLDVGVIAAVYANVPHLWHLREFCEEDFGIEFFDLEWKKALFVTSDFFAISKCIKEAYFNKYSIEAEEAIDCIKCSKLPPLKSKFTNDMIYLLIAGTISRGKGQIDAIRAMDVLINKGIYNLRLFIVGDGSQCYVWSLNRYIQERGLNDYIKILPFSEKLEEIRDFCDIALTCSKMEALGRVTMEAMIAGITVIGSDTGGTKELIGEQQERGFLYNHGNYMDLSQKIDIVLNDKEGREKKRRNAQSYIQEQINPILYAIKIRKAYDKSIDNFNEKKAYRKSLIKYIKMHEHECRYMDNRLKSCAVEIKPNKFRTMFLTAEKWIRVNQMERSVADFIRAHGYKTVAIYGMGYLGCDLYEELIKSQIIVLYVIDRMATEIGEWIPSVKPEDNLPLVDLIIITTSISNEDIKESLTSKYPYHVINLDDILDALLQFTIKEWIN